MKLHKLLAIIGCISMMICQYLIYIYSPIEKFMGVTQKIFYIHLPLAWWGLFSFFIVFVASILFLIKKDYRYDKLSHSAAEFGLVLATLALVTGSIWGKHSWGVWWTWDPRLTTTLILCFLYFAYLLFRAQDMNIERKAKISAAIGILAFVDVPLVFLSARMWRSIHPAVFANKGGGLEPEMKFTVIACVLSFGFIFASILMLRYKQLKQEAQLENINEY